MSSISYIHGLPVGNQIPRSSVPADEFKDRGALVPPPMFFNYPRYTQGQMNAALLLDQLTVLSSFYPERSDLAAAKNKVRDVLFKDGLQTSGISGSAYTDALRYVNQKLQKYARQTRPLSSAAVKGLHEPPLIQYSCDEFIEHPIGDYGQYLPPYYPQGEKAYLDCMEKIPFVITLNKELGNSSYHLLYAYANPTDKNAFATVAAKSQDHINGIGGLAAISGLGRDNMRNWVRNGILRTNVNGVEAKTPDGVTQIVKLGQPIQAEESIQLFKTGSIADNPNGVGELATLGIIITLIATALTAVAKIIDSINERKRLQLLSQAQNIGSEDYAPQESDWWKDQASGSSDLGIDTNTLLIGGLVLGGGLLAYQSFKN